METGTLYCNLYYDPTKDSAGTHYTFNKGEVPEGCILLQAVGCVQEAQRIESEEYQSLLDWGRSKMYESQEDAQPTADAPLTEAEWKVAIETQNQIMDYGFDTASGI